MGSLISEDTFGGPWGGGDAERSVGGGERLDFRGILVYRRGDFLPGRLGADHFRKSDLLIQIATGRKRDPDEEEKEPKDPTSDVSGLEILGITHRGE